MDFGTVLAAETGPLNGLVLPILISVSLAPGSYFFCAVGGSGMNAAASTPATMAPLRIGSSCEAFIASARDPRPDLRHGAAGAGRHKIDASRSASNVRSRSR